jgi:hypothetical protein
MTVKAEARIVSNLWWANWMSAQNCLIQKILNPSCVVQAKNEKRKWLLASNYDVKAILNHSY